MEHKCEKCDAQLPEQAGVCPECGAIVEPQPVADAKRPGKLKWWMIAIPAVLIVAILAAVLWQPIVFAIAPEAAMFAAAEKTTDAMKDYMAGGPLELLSSVDYTQNFQTGLYLKLGEAEDSSIVVNMDMGSDVENQRAMIHADVSVPGFDLNDLKVYSDTEGLAVAYDPFQNGQFYGLRFESFQEDMQSGELGAYIDQSVLEQLQTVFDQLQNIYKNENKYDALLEPYSKILMDFEENLTFSKGSQTILLDGADTKCNTVSFCISHDDFKNLCDLILAQMKEDKALKEYVDNYISFYGYVDSGDAYTYDQMLRELEINLNSFFENGQISATFTGYIYKGMLVSYASEYEVDYDGEQVQIGFVANYGKAPGKSPLYFEIVLKNNGEEAVLRMDSNIQQEDKRYVHTLSLTAEIPNEDTSSLKLELDWDKASGDLELMLKGNGEMEADESFGLNLKEEDKGFALSLEYEWDDAYSDFGYARMELTCAQGAEVTTPEYITPDKWTMSDLEALMNLLYSNLG